MNPIGGRRAQCWWAFVLLAVFSAALPGAQTAPQIQPTSSQDAQTIDQIWQRASSKYDSERSALLREVRRVASDGPYRADWQSLQKYEVPDWYKDAKFGIFIHWGLFRSRLWRRMVSP
jgi:alpha-L-fucosidase